MGFAIMLCAVLFAAYRWDCETGSCPFYVDDTDLPRV